jgi:CRP/FNR family cyclic AMP-dependent transcriptional regulator
MLRRIPLFSSLTDEQFRALLPSIQRRTYLPRSSIVRVGDNADGLYLIKSGSARVIIENGDSREFVVSVLRPNDFFGEIGLMDAGPSSVTVESRERCEVLHIPRRRFLECLQKNGSLAVLIVSALASRLRDAHRKIEGLALLTVYERVGRLMLDTSRDLNGEWRVELGTEQMAAMVGASREMVSRVIKGMIDGRLVARDKRQLILLNREAIAERPSTIPSRLQVPRNRDTRVATPPHNARSSPVTIARRRSMEDR